MLQLPVKKLIYKNQKMGTYVEIASLLHVRHKMGTRKYLGLPSVTPQIFTL